MIRTDDSETEQSPHNSDSIFGRHPHDRQWAEFFVRAEKQRDIYTCLFCFYVSMYLLNRHGSNLTETGSNLTEIYKFRFSLCF